RRVACTGRSPSLRFHHLIPSEAEEWSAIPLKKYYEMSRSEPDWHIRSATVVEAAVSTDPEIALRTPKTFASSTRYNRGYMPRVERLTSIARQGGGSANRPTCLCSPMVQWKSCDSDPTSPSCASGKIFCALISTTLSVFCTLPSMARNGSSVINNLVR